MEYIELTIHSFPDESRDRVIFQLSEEGFESFSEEGNIVKGYAQTGIINEKDIETFLNGFSVQYSWNTIREQNWNEVWEKNYHPVLINDRCFIRAPFHDPMPGIDFEIVIEPKMSFGTAHHETTSLMIELILDLELKRKRVLDMGCGTGILAILAGKAGAASVIAVDNDEWSYRNTMENIMKNNLEEIHVVLGDETAIHNLEVDVIFANINRNVLLDQIPAYGAIMNQGSLLLSGFYESDMEIILDKAHHAGYRLEKYLLKNQWVALKLNK